MSYYDNRSAKVKISVALENKGWKIFGFDEDQSDSMTDYFHPASWDGICEKNGYVLVIDNNNTRYSGYEVKKYNYNKQTYKASDRISKLEAMMNDPASTENEKASCAVLIEKEKEKQNIEPSYSLIETYPTFSHGNPKGSNWHIERDGQILAKGNGAFAVNNYDWEDKTKTREEQQAEKLAKFIAKIEKVLTDSDALKAEVIKVPKQVIKPVQKENTIIEINDILSFSYHGHFWIVTRIYTVGEQVRVTYELLGSEKRGYQRTSNAKGYYQPLARLEKEMNEGKVKVYTLQEVTEYVEKTVFKKTGRKQKVSDSIQLETSEEVATEAAAENKVNTDNSEQTTVQATLNINKDKNGIEIKFSEKPSVNVIESLKENGFRWSKFASVWWAKQSPERLKFAQMIVETYNSIIQEEPTQETTEAAEEAVNVEEVKEVPETVEAEQETEATEEAETAANLYNSNENSDQENVIYYDFVQQEEQQEEGSENMFEDLLSKFDNIEVTAEQRISADDLEFCQEQQNIFDLTDGAYNSLNESLQAIKPIAAEHGKKYGEHRNGYYHAKGSAYDAGFSVWDIEKNSGKIKERFISTICYYFMSRYNITIDYEAIQKKYDSKVRYENIVEEIYIQLGGFNFTEKAENEIKTKSREAVRNIDKITIKNNKLILDGYFVYHDSIWKEYRLNGKYVEVFKALQHFEDGSTAGNEELTSKYCGYENERKQTNYERYEVQTMRNIKSIKFLKNGKLEIEFTSNQSATKFAHEYCGYSQRSA